jgi:hypothetical protein
MTLDERIEHAGWFPGSDADWRALPIEQRDELAFKATGCAVAYATWEAPVDCMHVTCQIRRGEKPQIALVQVLGAAGYAVEAYDWLHEYATIRAWAKRHGLMGGGVC